MSARKEIPQGRIRAKNGGQMVRVCPLCGKEIRDRKRQVLSDDPFYAINKLKSYTTELDDTNYREHLAEPHDEVE
jgi:hypothetical protein